MDQAIDNTVCKVGRAVSIVRRISGGLPRDVITLVVNAIVISQLNYCLVVWSNALAKDIKKLQVLQNKAARCALRCSYTTNIKEMHGNLKWLSVKQRSSYFLLNYIRNIHVTQSPKVLYNR